jgi:hypothetical protein
VSSQLFAPISNDSMAGAPMGTRTKSGVYKMPLLPGEEGTKGGGDWVPGGLQSATNLAGSISETRALGIWERERTQLGLALRPDLYERLALLVNMAVRRDGLDLTQKLKDSDVGQRVRSELALIHEEARQACGANMAGQQGTNRHDVWEAHAFSGQLFGTPEINEQITALNALLAEKGLRRVRGLQERVVRNMELRAAGRFDDVLETTRELTFLVSTGEYTDDGREVLREVVLPAGTLIMGDLKTKKDPFWTLLEVGIQLVTYASAEYMLTADGTQYLPGPKYHVSQEWGAVLRMPVDGAPPHLIRIDLQQSMQDARLARAVCDARSRGKAVATHREAIW